MYRVIGISRLIVLTFLALFLARFANGQVQDYRHDAYARAHISWSLYHETGHAIQDFTGDRDVMSKQEREVHADKIAAFLMLPKREDPEEYQLYIDAAMDLYLDKESPEPGHFYEPSKVRAERMFCMLYGAKPNSQLLGVARRLKNRSNAECISEFQAFRNETVDILGFAREFTELEAAQFIIPRYPGDVAEKHYHAYNYLQETQILDDLAIDVEEWLPALQVSAKPFQIVAQECENGYDGFKYNRERSAVIACYAAVARCMNRPGHLLPDEWQNDPELINNDGDDGWDPGAWETGSDETDWEDSEWGEEDNTDEEWGEEWD